MAMEERDDKLELGDVDGAETESVAARLLLLELFWVLLRPVLGAGSGVANLSSVPAGSLAVLLLWLVVVVVVVCIALDAEGTGCVLSESRTIGLEREDPLADLPPPPAPLECAAAFIADV